MTKDNEIFGSSSILGVKSIDGTIGETHTVENFIFSGTTSDDTRTLLGSVLLDHTLNGLAYYIDATAIYVDGAQAGDMAVWQGVKGAVKNISGTLSFMDNSDLSTSATIKDTSVIDPIVVVINVDNSTKEVTFKVDGVAATTLSWTLNVKIVRV